MEQAIVYGNKNIPMIHDNILILISLLVAVFLLVIAANKLGIPYPLFLVIGGLLISFIPGIPDFRISPDLVFLIFLPPLLYEAAWYTSWSNFWKRRKVIGMLGFGMVIFTSCLVAVVSTSLIPGFTLALGFLLGGIISPPDAVAATSVLKTLNVPKSAMTILEGESLINDASSLIVFRFALAAVISGTFVFQDATIDFFVVTLMGIVIGLALANCIYVLHRWFTIHASMDAALTLVAPYLMYMLAEHFHYSGVMAVVSGGLFLSYRSHEIFNYRARLQTISVWSTVAFMLNGLVFILIGLQLRLITEGLGDYSLMEAIKYGLLISVLIIIIRLGLVFPLSYLPLWMRGKKNKEASPRWQNIFIIGWTGMRGVVSLASALSIPVMLNDTEAFPQRNLILFITFTTILITLVLQGITLPLVIKWLNIKDETGAVTLEEQQSQISLHLKKRSLNLLKENLQQTPELENNDLAVNLKKQLESDVNISKQKLFCFECREVEKGEVLVYKNLQRKLIADQRKALYDFRKSGKFEDEMLRKQEEQLDLDEAKLS
ncbi:Na+/H+ antiporter [Arcticibacter svalbardensis MN12-7]|uniref:Na+/H+ antiporter n=1 Tax=Arcticibacter svalbardensis MN12-7 TaxID=1150600 RepID=R9GP75_9SPHI|nr:Na+/H+ antiporter [Arcticibacter svalbardensis]EOR93632.1 Na+/H+ antiporter [Arcticibacter svalbardensis MN12-7]